jgi:hypothetical protein
MKEAVNCTGKVIAEQTWFVLPGLQTPVTCGPSKVVSPVVQVFLLTVEFTRYLLLRYLLILILNRIQGINNYKFYFMRQYNNLFVTLLLLVFAVSCKKDEKRVMLLGGTAPQLTAPAFLIGLYFPIVKMM